MKGKGAFFFFWPGYLNFHYVPLFTTFPKTFYKEKGRGEKAWGNSYSVSSNMNVFKIKSRRRKNKLVFKLRERLREKCLFSLQQRRLASNELAVGQTLGPSAREQRDTGTSR